MPRLKTCPTCGSSTLRLRRAAKEVRILDPLLIDAYIRERQQRGVDGPDETWDGVYTVPVIANNPQQSLVAVLTASLFSAIVMTGRGRVHSGANVSDRREGWEARFRVPDVVVVLNDGQAVDCDSHWMGGPDFLVEITSPPRDETADKIPFYSELKVRELLVIDRDTRQLQLYRHNGKKLVPVKPSTHAGGKWLVSRVVPLAFLHAGTDDAPKLEISRTDGTAGTWTA